MLAKVLTRLRMLQQDRGEGPVPYIIIVAIIAIVAGIIAYALRETALGWLDLVPEPGETPAS